MLNNNYLLIKAKALDDEILDLGDPGQFYQLKVHSDSFQLRVPISIFNIESNIISFLIKIVGGKTKKLQSMKESQVIDVIGPLGTSFLHLMDKRVSDNEVNNNRYLFVSGGCGFAPISFLYKHLTAYNEMNKDISPQTQFIWIHGGKNYDDVSFISEQLNVIITTEDGSVGTEGLVTESAIEQFKENKIDIVFTCGPVAMMKALFEICKLNNTPLIVSLEEYMACGIGVCYGCAVKTKNTLNEESYARVCKDGPIFDAEEVFFS
jgi:dihydroorotate dehydrogenase electron transfer subunit